MKYTTDGYSVRRLLMTSFDDIVLLRQKKLIGRKLKPKLLQNDIFIFTGPLGDFGAAIRMQGGAVVCQPTCPSPVPLEQLGHLMQGISYTVYKLPELKIIYDPIYSEQELG